MNLLSFVLLAGGASTRMGKDKGLVILKGKPLIQYVLDEIDEFLNILNLKAKIPIKIVLHDHIQQEEYMDAVPNLKDDQIIVDEVVWNSVYSDIPQPPQGSLYGLWSAMTELRNDSRNIFVLSCDTPFLSRTILSYILNEYFRNDIPSKLGVSRNKIINYNKISNNFSGKKDKKSKIKSYNSYIPQWNNGIFEPFFAIYHVKSLLPLLEQKILRKHYSFQKIFKELAEDPKFATMDGKQYNISINTIKIEEELKKYDINFLNFIDVNSEENLRTIENMILTGKKNQS